MKTVGTLRSIKALSMMLLGSFVVEAASEHTGPSTTEDSNVGSLRGGKTKELGSVVEAEAGLWSEDSDNSAASFALLAHKMVASQEDGSLRDAFDVFDENADGFLSIEELCEYYFYLWGEECTSTRASILLKMADSDNDGKVSFEEFVGIAA